MMSGIRGKNTKPELLVRQGLHARGFRYRLHGKLLPGKPDLVFPKYKAVVFVHGCFWHGHDCHLFKVPSTRQDFWLEKINGNRARDGVAESRLLSEGWRVATIWECALKGRTMLPLPQVLDECAAWLAGGEHTLDIRGLP
jgi:DNA mismatch endonuclease, patch repair protein